MAKCYKDGALIGNIKIGGNQVMAVVKDNVDLWSYPFGGIVLQVVDDLLYGRSTVLYSPGISLSSFVEMRGNNAQDGGISPGYDRCEIIPGYDRFVIETYQGFFVSTNGISWEKTFQKGPYEQNLTHRLIFVDGVFFSIHGGYLWYSVDGRNFDYTCAIPSGKTFEYFCSGNGIIFATGFYYSNNKRHSSVFRTEDAQNWIASSLDIVGDEAFSCVGFGGGSIVAFTVFDDYVTQTVTYKAYRSTDNGATFSQASGTISEKVISVAYGGGKFVAITQNGKIYTSSNGSSWSLSTTIQTLTFGGVFYAENKFFVYGTELDASYNIIAGRMYSSTDGSSWSNVYTANGKFFRQACYCNKEMNRYWLVGASGMAKFSDDNVRTWRSKSITSSNITCICNYNDTTLFAGISGNALYKSSDFGNTWSQAASLSPSSVKITSICTNGSRLVAITEYTTTSNYVFSSDDKFSSYDRSYVSGGKLYDVCWGNGKFVAVGTNKIMYSTDGKTWTNVSGISGSFTKVACDGTNFVATCSNGTIYYSSNGTTWSQGGSGPSSIECLFYTGAQFLCGGSSNGKAKVYYSNDNGVTWVDWTSVPDLNGSIKAIFRVDQGFAMFGCDKTLLYNMSGMVTYDNQGSSNATAVCSIAGRILP